MRQPGSSTLSLGILDCATSDRRCLDPDQTHDFSQFRVTFLPRPTDRHDTPPLVSQMSGIGSPGVPLMLDTVTFDLPVAAPTSHASTVVRFGFAPDGSVALTAAPGCEPPPTGTSVPISQTPLRVGAAAPLSLIDGTTALARAVPVLEPTPAC